MNDKLKAQNEWKEWIGIGGLLAVVGALTTAQWMPAVQEWYAAIDMVASQINYPQVAGFLFFVVMVGLYIRQQRSGEPTMAEAGDETVTVVYEEPKFLNARVVE